MRKAGAAGVALFLLAAVPASAQSISAPSYNGIGDPGVGVGIICNTSEQAERFITLRGQGTEAKSALETVNAEVNDDRACGIAAVAFLRDETIKTRPMGNRLVQIVRINVVAGYNGKGWQRASATTVQYAVVEAQGQAI
ncbi:MAG: hypothetical protein Q7T81_01415 [Pseudolabrys sp.]|nr:hypothetical protein [Pseudolabrys sp.]